MARVVSYASDPDPTVRDQVAGIASEMKGKILEDDVDVDALLAWAITPRG